VQILLQDIRHPLRQLRQAPAFALTALLPRPSAIGATTAIFTLTQAIMLKSLPVADRLESRERDPKSAGA
jgi:hypothetical protein